MTKKNRKMTSKYTPSSYLHRNFVISSYLRIFIVHDPWNSWNPCLLWMIPYLKQNTSWCPCSTLGEYPAKPLLAPGGFMIPPRNWIIPESSIKIEEIILKKSANQKSLKIMCWLIRYQQTNDSIFLNQLCQKINSLYLSFECACWLGQLTSLPRCKRFQSGSFLESYILLEIDFPHPICFHGSTERRLWWYLFHNHRLHSWNFGFLPEAQLPQEPRQSLRKTSNLQNLWHLSAKPHRVNLRSKTQQKRSILSVVPGTPKGQHLNKHTNIT